MGMIGCTGRKHAITANAAAIDKEGAQKDQQIRELKEELARKRKLVKKLKSTR